MPNLPCKYHTEQLVERGSRVISLNYLGDTLMCSRGSLFLSSFLWALRESRSTRLKQSTGIFSGGVLPFINENRYCAYGLVMCRATRVAYADLQATTWHTLMDTIF